IVSGLIANVPGAFVAGGDRPIAVDVDATQSNGLTAASVQNATLIAPPPSTLPTFSGLLASTNLAGVGATRDVVLTGLNLTELSFSNCAPCDTIDFGPGITVVGTPTISPDGQRITVKIQVDAS